MRIDLPTIPPSLNKTLRMHWAQRRDMQTGWKLLIRSEWTPNGEPIGQMKVKITMHHSRLYDKDNAYGAVKPIIDALKDWRIIKDDTKEWLELSVEQEKCPHKQRHTVIEVWPA